MSNVVLSLSKCRQILASYEDCVSKRKADHEVGSSIIACSVVTRERIKDDLNGVGTRQQLCR